MKLKTDTFTESDPQQHLCSRSSQNQRFLLHRGLQLFQEGKLPVCADGRLSAGPLDLPAFLAQASLCLLLPIHLCALFPRHDFVILCERQCW